MHVVQFIPVGFSHRDTWTLRVVTDYPVQTDHVPTASIIWGGTTQRHKEGLPQSVPFLFLS